MSQQLSSILKSLTQIINENSLNSEGGVLEKTLPSEFPNNENHSNINIPEWQKVFQATVNSQAIPKENAAFNPVMMQLSSGIIVQAAYVPPALGDASFTWASPFTQLFGAVVCPWYAGEDIVSHTIAYVDRFSGNIRRNRIYQWGNKYLEKDWDGNSSCVIGVGV